MHDFTLVARTKLSGQLLRGPPHQLREFLRIEVHNSPADYPPVASNELNGVTALEGPCDPCYPGWQQ